MAGIPVTQNDLNFRAGQLTVDLRNKLAEVGLLKRWLDDHDDQELVALGLSPEDAALTRAAITDLDKLARIAVGQETQSPASDFFFNARLLTGLN